MSAVAVRKAALAAKLAAETAANPVTPVSSGQVSAHQTLDEDAVDSQQDGGSNSSRITEARNKKVSSRGSALTKKLRRASKPSGNKTLERRYYQEDIKEVSDSENDMELATEALDAASGSDQDFHFELGDSLYPGSGATTPSGRPKKKRRVSTDEQASYSNFQPTLGINICQISKEALARYPNLAQKGTAVCVSLHPDEYFTFSGLALITPLVNRLSVFSTTLTPVSRLEEAVPLRLFAPLTNPLPILQPASKNTNQLPAQSREDLDSLGIPDSLLTRDRTVFLIQSLSCGIEKLGQAVMKLGKVWPGADARGAFGLRGAFPILQPPEHAVYPYSTPQTWSTALQALVSPSLPVDTETASDDEDEANSMETYDRSAALITIVKGPKRSGKSTFAREATNKLLERYEKVAYLDCDLGQSEFAPGGTVGLYIVDSPLLGPSFTHPRQPVKSHFVGSLNPRLLPEHYLNSISSLVEHFRYEVQYPTTDVSNPTDKISEVVPLIVNTQGWVKGIGAELLERIEAEVQATHTFSFAASSTSLFPSYGDEAGPSFTGEQYDLSLEQLTSSGFGSIIQLEPAPSSGLFSRFSAADYRTLSTMAYLHARLSTGDGEPSWDFSTPLVATVPWEVDFDAAGIKDIYITGEGSDYIVSDDLGLALNGSIVALIETDADGDAAQGDAERYIQARPLPAPSQSTCLGLGLVRAISPDQPSCVQLLTPLAPEDLSRVRAIAVGEIELPLCASLDWTQSTSVNQPNHQGNGITSEGMMKIPWPDVPFLTIRPERGAGAGRRKFRRNIMRKNQLTK